MKYNNDNLMGQDITFLTYIDILKIELIALENFNKFSSEVSNA